MTRGLFIKSFGCQMNVYDADRMADIMALDGYSPVANPEDADLIILNTCHIREKAAHKLYSDLGRVRAGQAGRNATLDSGKADKAIIVVAGCVAQAEGREIFARAPFVDIVIGPQTYHRLPELVKAASRGERRLLDTEFPVESKFDHLPARDTSGPVSAFLTVQEGCDKFCSFCVVPYTRGAEYSRPVEAILAEATQLVQRGARELTLLGQNVNAYHGKAKGGGVADLAALFAELSEIADLARLRYTTSHPLDMNERLIAAHRDQPKLMPFMHLPVQSGSDSVLARMNRKHTVADYRRIIAKLRAARPDIALSSDFIVGYPGESEADFAATLALVDEVNFAQAYAFRFSPRPGTPAASGDGQIPEAEKEQRLAILLVKLNAQQTEYNRSLIGRTLPILFEKPGRYEGQIIGRTPYLQPVHVSGETSLIGTIRDVAISQEFAFSLGGMLADRQASATVSIPARTDSQPIERLQNHPFEPTPRVAIASARGNAFSQPERIEA